MVIKIEQAYYDMFCDYCPNQIQQGDLYLYTNGFGRSRSYCFNCAYDKKGYSNNYFKTFRPHKEIESLI